MSVKSVKVMDLGSNDEKEKEDNDKAKRLNIRDSGISMLVDDEEKKILYDVDKMECEMLNGCYSKLLDCRVVSIVRMLIIFSEKVAWQFVYASEVEAFNKELMLYGDIKRSHVLFYALSVFLKHIGNAEKRELIPIVAKYVSGMKSDVSGRVAYIKFVKEKYGVELDKYKVAKFNGGDIGIIEVMLDDLVYGSGGYVSNMRVREFENDTLNDVKIVYVLLVFFVVMVASVVLVFFVVNGTVKVRSDDTDYVVVKRDVNGVDLVFGKAKVLSGYEKFDIFDKRALLDDLPSLDSIDPTQVVDNVKDNFVMLFEILKEIGGFFKELRGMIVGLFVLLMVVMVVIVFDKLSFLVRTAYKKSRKFRNLKPSVMRDDK